MQNPLNIKTLVAAGGDYFGFTAGGGSVPTPGRTAEQAHRYLDHGVAQTPRDTGIVTSRDLDANNYVG